MNTTKLTPKEQKEAASLLVEAQKKSKAPEVNTDADLLQLTMPQLNAYIKQQTKGMKIHKKMKFGTDLIKRIEKAKKKANQ